jgi:protein O-mannosyl-transferase
VSFRLGLEQEFSRARVPGEPQFGRNSASITRVIRCDVVLCLILSGLTWLVYAQSLSFGFVNFDDDKFVSENPHVSAGLKLSEIAWAFTNVDADNWHPLTTLSQMLDCELFGLRAGGHHFTNLLLHNISVVLVFLWLARLTGRTCPSFLVAAIFAVHPQHVESVAWIAERKDVLSGVFFMLTLIVYVWYARKLSYARYASLFLIFLLALMTKPMLVSVPVVLLLLDYWPLNRITDRFSFSKCLIEKLPLAVPAGIVALVTILAQKRAFVSTAELPIWLRLANGAVAIVKYLIQFFWPAGLSPFYPHPGIALWSWTSLAAGIFLALLTAVILVTRKKYLITGWLWFLVMLVPVAGLIQTSTQARADRYTYLPGIGFCIALVWLASAIARRRVLRFCVNLSAIIFIVALTLVARTQAAYWRNSETLWGRALSLYPESGVIHFYMATFLFREQRFEEALPHLRTTVRLLPTYAEPHFQLGLILAQNGATDEAIEQFRAALAFGYDTGLVHSRLGSALARKGHSDEALKEFQNAVSLQPHLAEAESNIGEILLARGDSSGALAHFRKVVALAPNNPTAHYNLAVNLGALDRTLEAIEEFETTLKLDPDYPGARENLASLKAKGSGN